MFAPSDFTGLAIGRQTMQPVFDFLAASKGKPFFLWFAPMLPHNPHTPPERLLARYRDKTDSIHIARYWAMCEWWDERCGELLAHLDDQGLTENTLVVYASAVTLKPNDASMSAEINTHGLDKLLDGYGIQINKDAVLDFGAQFRIGVPTQGGVAWIRHPGIAHVINDPRLDEGEKALDTSFPAFFRMDEVIMPFPSSLKAKMRPGLRARASASLPPERPRPPMAAMYCSPATA